METYFPASKMRAHLRSGPSGPYLDGFAAALERQGYSAGTAVRYLRAAAHLGHVAARQGAMPSEIDLAAFSEHLRGCRCPRAMGGRRNHHTIFGARLFRQHLMEIGVFRSPAAALEHAEPCLVAQFKEWLRKHRGASDPTIRLYARDAAHLAAALGDDPERWEPAAIRCFFLDRASCCGKGTVEKLTTSLRAFLRYLAVKGRCRADLADVVPGYARWRLADLPRSLAAEQVNRLIAACDGEVVERRRDRAILLLLARLGLRAGGTRLRCARCKAVQRVEAEPARIWRRLRPTWVTSTSTQRTGTWRPPPTSCATSPRLVKDSSPKGGNHDADCSSNRGFPR